MKFVIFHVILQNQVVNGNWLSGWEALMVGHWPATICLPHLVAIGIVVVEIKCF